MKGPPVSNPRDRTTRDPQPANDRAGALAELRARVENATGPDRELDGHLYGALGFQIIQRFGGFEWRPDGKGVWQTMPSPTASLDAAIALCGRVLPGWSWHVAGADQHAGSCDDRSFAALAGEPEPIARDDGFPDFDRPVFEARAPTPALALLSAMLAALEASPLNASADGSQ